MFAARPNANEEHLVNRADCVCCRLLAGDKLIWRKYAIRAPDEPGSETWRDETWRDENKAWQAAGSERNQTMLFAFGHAATAIACR